MVPLVQDGKHTVFFRYGLALGLTLLVFAVRLVLDPLLGARLSFLPFALAVMISAAVGGVGPGLLSTLLSVVTAMYFWQEPRFEFSIENERQLAEVLMFFAVATGINFFAATVIKALRAAREANMAKDQFLAMLSHELRTPLNPVMLSASDMERDETLPAHAREEMAMIHRNIGLEARLIDDLLDLTRISKGKIRLHTQVVDIRQLLAESHRILEHEAAQKHQTVTIRTDARAHHVQGDPARLQQVFWNLIKNAIKFTGEGGHITIRSLNRDDGRLSVQVTDNGVGIAPDALSTIFSAFEQGGDTITRRFGGLGLGLTISKGLVELHGGELTAESEGVGKGATMTVTLPVTTEAIPEKKTEASDQFAAGASILVVDDDEPTARTLARLLSRRGYDVETATACAPAREILRNRRFDIMIADLSLPDGSGLDLMREMPPASRTRGIALSGFGTEADLQASLAAGFTTHLVKPVDIDELTTAIRGLRTA